MTRDPIARIVRNIRVAMIDKTWNQADLARALGVNEDWLSRRLRQQTDLSVKELFRIAGALDVPAQSLLAGIEATGWEPQVRVLPPRRSLLPGDRPVRYTPPLAELADAA